MISYCVYGSALRPIGRLLLAEKEGRVVLLHFLRPGNTRRTSFARNFRASRRFPGRRTF
ncbi:MAG: hypothetical protein M5R36_02040 [Deltaproteobacteria bacterium]|nr:hypothetical protein [Deltaproteobacteria bacterium]